MKGINLLSRMTSSLWGKASVSILIGALASAGIFFTATPRYIFEATAIVSTPFVRGSLFNAEDSFNSAVWTREGLFLVNSLFSDAFLSELIDAFPELEAELRDYTGTAATPTEDEKLHFINEVLRAQFKIELLGTDSGTFHIEFRTVHKGSGKNIMAKTVARFTQLTTEPRQQALQDSLKLINVQIKTKLEDLMRIASSGAAYSYTQTSLQSEAIPPAVQNELLKQEINDLTSSRQKLLLLSQLVESEAAQKVHLVKHPSEPSKPAVPQPKQVLLAGLAVALASFFFMHRARQWWSFFVQPSLGRSAGNHF